MLAYISIGSFDLANTLLQQFPSNVPISLLEHVINVCESLLQDHTAVGFRAQENAMLELISKLDIMCGNSPRYHDDTEDVGTLKGIDDNNNTGLSVVNEEQEHLFDYNLPTKNVNNTNGTNSNDNRRNPISPSRSPTTSSTTSHQEGVDEFINNDDFFNDLEDDDEKERLNNLINAGLYVKQ